MGVERLCNGAGVLVVGAARRLAAALILVDVRNGEDQVIDLHHHQRLNQIAIDRIPHTRSTGLGLQPATPTWMVSVDLIPQRRHAVLPEEHGALDLLLSDLPLLDLKPESLQL